VNDRGKPSGSSANRLERSVRGLNKALALTPFVPPGGTPKMAPVHAGEMRLVRKSRRPPRAMCASGQVARHQPPRLSVLHTADGRTYAPDRFRHTAHRKARAMCAGCASICAASRPNVGGMHQVGFRDDIDDFAPAISGGEESHRRASPERAARIAGRRRGKWRSAVVARAFPGFRGAFSDCAFSRLSRTRPTIGGSHSRITGAHRSTVRAKVNVECTVHGDR